VDVVQRVGQQVSELLTLVAILLVGTSGMPGALLPRQSALGERIATLFMIAGSACGLAGAFGVAGWSHSGFLSLPWSVPGGEFAIRIDGISAIFLAPIFLISPLGSIYGLDYWRQAEHPDNGRKVRLFFGLLTAAMALLVVAENSILFLVGWETMALSAFLLITTEDSSEAVRETGFIYLAATRLGTLCLFAMFAVLRFASGGWTFGAPGQVIAPSVANAIFLLAVAGFGLKAGVMPMHVWLPGAHANAPSHVSALMSGVLIKTGIYGLVRICSFFDRPPMWWGLLLLAIGIVSGVLGVAFALAQHDLKRLLAYHSVENIGIIAMGLGVAVMGRSLGQPTVVALGLAGALLHVWNHCLFKALLFFCAGSVLHATHTRDIDHLGGLAKKMPLTALGFLTGAVAICGLPPLNGFVSELFLYLGLFQSALLDSPRVWIAGIVGAPALALIGALALACFAKVFGAVFLGSPRSEHVKYAKESSLWMTAPVLVLGAGCAFIGLVPIAVAPILERATMAWAPDLSAAPIPLASVAPLAWLSMTGFALLVLLVLGVGFLVPLVRPSRSARGVTWDCGYAAPSSRMQYTASSFAELLVGIFSWALHPVERATRPATLFPQAVGFSSQVPDVVLDRAVLPASRRVARAFVWFRWLQHGSIHMYLLYVLATLLLTILLRR
jgi:hydrogenase-4 component B